MGPRFSDISIRRKLVSLVVVSTAIALLLSTTLIVGFDYLARRSSLVTELETTANILAHTSTASLAFEDRTSAARVLESLEAQASVVSATLLDSAGRPFARYVRPGFDAEALARDRYVPDGHVFDGDYLLIEHGVDSVAGQLGTLYLQVDLTELRSHSALMILIGVGVAVLSCAIAVMLSSRFQRSVSVPILSLAELAGRISERGDYSTRAHKTNDDEIGTLVDAFNDMLQRVQDRDAELESNRDELEHLVDERTHELMRSQESLRRSERLATVGTLAAGIAHQINNPIGSILNGAQYALLCEGDDDYIDIWRRSLGDHESEARRCGRIVRSILQFSRDEPTERWSDDLTEVARRSVMLATPYAEEQCVTLHFRPAPESMPAVFSPIEIEQVLVNLIRNAIEAVEVPPGDVQVTLWASDDWVRVTVTDDGQGIPADQVNRVFDPFFTTRLPLGGTGLGLSVAHGIIVDHGGTLEVESEVGKGSTFTVSLPRDGVS
jgi:signal transduction histidine kinase